MASGAPKKVLTVAMTLGLMASVLSTVPVTPAVAQGEAVANETAGITPVGLDGGDEADDLSLVHHRDNYNPYYLRQQYKLPEPQKHPQRPQISVPDQSSVVGENVNFDLLGVFKGFQLREICVFGLPPGLNFDRSGRVVGRPTTPGNYTVRVVVKSGYYSHTFHFQWAVHPRNVAPKAAPQNVSFQATNKPGTVDYVPLNITDDQELSTLRVDVQNKPEGSRVVFRGGAWFLEVPTTNPMDVRNLRVVVTDICHAQGYADFSLTVHATQVNKAPIGSFVPIAQQATGHAGTKATALITVTDDGLPNGTLTLRPKHKLPAGWVFGGSNGQWSLTVPSDKPIPLTGVEFIASDGELETLIRVGICIWEKPATPSYAPIGLVNPVTTVEGTPVRQPIFVYDADSKLEDLTVTVSGENPSNVRVERDGKGGWVLVVPADRATNGAVTTELKVTDNTGQSSTFPAIVTVDKNIPTVIGDIANQSHWVGTNISLDVPVDRSYFGQVEVAGLPSGLRYDHASGKIVGTITAPTPGAQQVTVSLIVKGQRVTKNFTWTAIRIDDRNNRIGDKVDWDLSGHVPGGVKASQITVEGLPEGLRFENGRIVGTVAGGVKNYTVTFTVKGTIHTTTFKWNIGEKSNSAVPTGSVDSVFARIGSGDQVRKITLADADTPLSGLTVSINNPVPGVSVRRAADGSWELVVKTDKVIDRTDVTFEVTDGKNRGAFKTTIAVTPGAKITEIDDQRVYFGDSISTITVGGTGISQTDTFTVEGLDGTGLTYDSATRKISGKPNKVGVINVKVVLKDESGRVIDTEEFKIHVVDRPIVDSTAPTGAVSNVSATVGDPEVKAPISLSYGKTDVSKLQVAIEGQAPAGVKVVKEDGRWILVVSTAQVIKQTQITYKVTDPASGKSSTFTNFVKVDPLNRGPVVETINVTVRNNAEHRIPIRVSDPDGDKVVNVLVGNNAYGINVHRKADGGFELVIPKGIPANDYTIHLVAVDERGAQGGGKATVKVTDNSAPKINSESASIDLADLKAKGFSFDVKTSDPDKDPITLSQLGSWPAGISLDAKTGKVVYSKDLAPGSYTVTVNASDGFASAAGTFTLVVKAPQAPAAPSIDNIDDQTNTIGDDVNVKIVVRNASKEDVRVFGLPPGLSYDVNTGAIVGKPNVKGNYTVGVVVVTKGGVAQTTFNWTIKEPQTTAPSKTEDLGSRANRVGIQIAPYNVNADVRSKIKGEIDSIEVYGLPQGLSYNPTTGLITGTPTVEAKGVDVTVKVTNKGGHVLLPFTWTIFAKPSIKVPNQVTDTNTKVTLDIKPFVIDGRPNEKVDASKITVEGLPQGLKYNADGTITGTTPATPQAPVKVTVTATTSDGVEVTGSFTWEIKAPAATAKPMGQVEAIVARQGDADVIKRVALSDFDTPTSKLVVAKVGNWPAGVELVKVSEGVYDVVVKTDKVIAASQITLSVTDGTNTTEFKGFVEVKPQAKIADIPSQDVTLGKPINPVKVTVVNELPGDVVTGISSDPGVKWDSAKREFTGTPTKMGKVTLTVTVTTADGRKMDEKSGTVNVVCEPNIAPTVTTTPLVGVKGQPFAPVPLIITDDTTALKDMKVKVESNAPVSAKFDGKQWVLELKTDNKLDPTPVQITVTDKDGLNGSTSTVAVVSTTKSKARLQPIPDQQGTVNKPVNPVKVIGLDMQPGDKIVVENLPKGITFDPKTNVIGGTPTEVKDTLVTVTIVDGDGNLVDRDTFTFSIKAPLAPPANKKPAVSAPDMIFPEGQKREVGVTVADEDPKSVKVTFAEGEVPGISLKQDDQGGWVLVADGTKPLDTKVTLVATDKEGAKSDPYVVNIKTFRAQVSDLDPMPKQKVEVGQAIKPQTVKVNNEQDGDVVEIAGVPSWLKFDAKTRTFTGTPDVEGITTITVILKNKAGVIQDTELFEITAVPAAKPKAPTGMVNPVIARVGDPVIKREIFVHDADTPVEQLVVTRVSGPEIAQLEKNGNRWFLVVNPTAELKTTPVVFKVSDGKLETTFSTSVTVDPKADSKFPRPSIDNPGGQTSTEGKPIDPVEVPTKNVPKDETPKVEGLPEGLTPKWDPNTGVITITGTPTKPTTTPVKVTISVTDPNEPDNKIKQEFPWQVNPKDGDKLAPKGWVNPVVKKVGEEPAKQPIMLADADTPIKDLKVTMTSAPEGVKLTEKAPGEYTLDVPTDKVIPTTKVTFQVTDGKFVTLFETTVTVEDDKKPDVKAPTGVVNPVIAFVGDPTVKREIFVHDADTPVEKLVVTLVKGPDVAKLVKEGNRWFMVVEPTKKVESEQVDFKVSDGKNENTFSTSVTVKEKPQSEKPTPSIDNPGGQTSTEGKPIDPVEITTKDVPKGETPKVEGLPEGLTPKFDPNTGVITITGIPTKPTKTPVKVTITVPNPNDPNKPIVEEFPWQVNPKDGDKFAPKGWVNPVKEKVAQGKRVTRPVSLADADTPIKDLKVSMTKAPEGVKLVEKAPGVYEMEVALDKEITPITKVEFQVTDGPHVSLFETTVLVERGTQEADDLTIDVPDGRTVVNTPLPALPVTLKNATPDQVTFDKPLPPGIVYNKDKGVIEGTPTVAGVTKLVATVTAPDGRKNSDEFTITVTQGVPGPTPRPSDGPSTNPGNKVIPGTRLSGPTRIETAIAISRRQFKDQSVQNVVIARSDIYADANAGTPFAEMKGAPIFLTTPNELHAEVEKEIRRILKPGGEIWIMGREEAISFKVQDDLKAKFPNNKVDRIGGPNRFGTAAMIYDQLGSPNMVSIVDGDDEYVGDALVAGTAMAYKDGAVLYTSKGRINPETDPVLKNGKVKTVYTYDPTVTDGFTQIVGKDTVERSIATARTHWAAPTQVGVASSNTKNVVDALTGGAMIARRKAPMLLTPTDVNDTRVQTYIAERVEGGLNRIWLYGGVAAVPQNVADALGGKGVKIQWDNFDWTNKTPENPDD